jgi:hypothetical protein
MTSPKDQMFGLKNFLEHDYFIFRKLGINPESISLKQWLTYIEIYQQSQKKNRYFIGVPIELKYNQIGIDILDWANKQAQTTIFFYISLGASKSIDLQLKLHPPSLGTDIHILPDVDLNYDRFKEKLWDLHLAGFHVYFHHVNEVKSFAKNTDLFRKLARRGVSIGISTNWRLSWIGNDVAKIRTLIDDLNIHFFNTECIDVGAYAYLKEQENQKQILKFNN